MYACLNISAFSCQPLKCQKMFVFFLSCLHSIVRYGWDIVVSTVSFFFSNTTRKQRRSRFMQMKIISWIRQKDKCELGRNRWLYRLVSACLICTSIWQAKLVFVYKLCGMPLSTESVEQCNCNLVDFLLLTLEIHKYMHTAPNARIHSHTPIHFKFWHMIHIVIDDHLRHLCAKSCAKRPINLCEFRYFFLLFPSEKKNYENNENR